jgi:predicted transcriptional regulator
LADENYIHKLAQFGLNPEEAIVYITLLENGSQGNVVGRLKNKLEIGRTTIYGILDRLIEKGWVKGIDVKKKPKRTKYIACSPLITFDKIIKEKGTELKNIKDTYLFIGDKLEKIYQEKKQFTIENIHPSAIKYLKPLFNRKWRIKSEVIERSESLGRTIFDYELEAKKGFPTKDCGLVIFDYDRIIEYDKNIINAAIATFKSKTEYEIRNHDIPGFEDVKIEDAEFGDILGAMVYIKLKIKNEWMLAGNQAVIPIKNKIFLIHGDEQNFQILMETVINAEKFHHLV